MPPTDEAAIETSRERERERERESVPLLSDSELAIKLWFFGGHRIRMENLAEAPRAGTLMLMLMLPQVQPRLQSGKTVFALGHLPSVGTELWQDKGAPLANIILWASKSPSCTCKRLDWHRPFSERYRRHSGSENVLLALPRSLVPSFLICFTRSTYTAFALRRNSGGKRRKIAHPVFHRFSEQITGGRPRGRAEDGRRDVEPG